MDSSLQHERIDIDEKTIEEVVPDSGILTVVKSKAGE